MMVPCLPGWPRVWCQIYDVLRSKGANKAAASKGAGMRMAELLAAEWAKVWLAQEDKR